MATGKEDAGADVGVAEATQVRPLLPLPLHISRYYGVGAIVDCTPSNAKKYAINPTGSDAGPCGPHGSHKMRAVDRNRMIVIKFSHQSLGSSEPYGVGPPASDHTYTAITSSN